MTPRPFLRQADQWPDRTAMPAVDAYDTRYPPEERDPYLVVPSGPWYHGSDHDLPDGTELVPGGGKSKWSDVYEGGWEERPNWVWLSDDPDEAEAWGRNIYQVEPTEDGPHRWNGQAYDNDYVAQRARVIRRLTPEEFRAIPRRELNEPMTNQQAIDLLEDLLSGGGDTLRAARLLRIAAALAPEVPQRLQQEYDDWAEGRDPLDFPSPDKADYGVGHWPNIENFMKDKYPAAHRGLFYGMEDAQPLLDNPGGNQRWLKGKDPYAGGPEALEEYGYDPSEVAAGMLLLHNQAHGRREHFYDADAARLTDIARKRQRMQPRAAAVNSDDWHERTTTPAQLRKEYGESINFGQPTEKWRIPDRLYTQDYIDQKKWETRPPTDGQEQLGQDTLPGMEDILGEDTALWRGTPIDTHDSAFRRVWQMTYGQGEPVDDPGMLPDADLRYEDRGGRFDHPDLADAILKGFEERGGVGTHHSTDPGIADEYARGWGDGSYSDKALALQGPQPLPVLMQTQWNGRGENYDRKNTGMSPEEQEIILRRQQAPLEVRQLMVPESAQDSGEMMAKSKPQSPWWDALGGPAHITAAVNQDFVDRLNTEFSDWYTGGGIDQDEAWEDHLDPISSDVPARGPVGDWGNIERFLGEKYPAAHKGLGMGQEEAGHVLDGRAEMPYLKSQGVTPYDTGPDALATHGYDPAEVASAMLLLHNRSHPLRGDLAEEDQNRLTDIFTKRQQMQRQWEERTAAWKVDPNYFGALHEMAHTLDAAGNWKASQGLKRMLYDRYTAETGDPMGEEPGAHNQRYLKWILPQLPGRAFDQPYVQDFNPKEAVAAAFAEHESNPEASSPLVKAIHQHLIDNSEGGRGRYLPTFRPRGRGEETAPMPRGFTDGVQHVLQKYPQSRILDMVEPVEMGEYGTSPVTNVSFGDSWDNRPKVRYDDRAALYPDLVDDTFHEMIGSGEISPWMWEPDEAEKVMRAAMRITTNTPWDDEGPGQRRNALVPDPRIDRADPHLHTRVPHIPLDGPVSGHPATERFQEFLDAQFQDPDPREALEEYLSVYKPHDRMYYEELQRYIGDEPTDSYPFPPAAPPHRPVPFAEVTYPPGYEMDYDDPHPGTHYRAARRVRQANTHLTAHEPTREPIMSRTIQGQADQWPRRIAKPALIPGRDTSVPPQPDDWLAGGEAEPMGKQQVLGPQPKRQALPKDPKPEPLPEQLGLFPRPAGPYDAGTQSPFSTGGMDGYNWSDSLVQDQMYDSMIEKYNAADPEIREWGTEWYDNANKYIQGVADKTGRTVEQVAGVVSAFSPRTAWDPANLTQATHFLLNYDPKNPDALNDNWPGLSENLKRAKRIADTKGDYDSVLEALQGAGKDAPKITSFYKNMLGDEDAVTMDTWMARAIFGQGQDMFDGDASQQVLGWAGAYDHMSDAVRRAAKDLGISPRALQAIVWTQVNPQADYSEMTPERAQAQQQKKEKAWKRQPPGNPQPDYTKGPAYDATDEDGRPYLPPPTYRSAPGFNRGASADDDFGFFL